MASTTIQTYTISATGSTARGQWLCIGLYSHLYYDLSDDNRIPQGLATESTTRAISDNDALPKQLYSAFLPLSHRRYSPGSRQRTSYLCGHRSRLSFSALAALLIRNRPFSSSLLFQRRLHSPQRRSPTSLLPQKCKKLPLLSLTLAPTPSSAPFSTVLAPQGLLTQAPAFPITYHSPSSPLQLPLSLPLQTLLHRVRPPRQRSASVPRTMDSFPRTSLYPSSAAGHMSTL